MANWSEQKVKDVSWDIVNTSTYGSLAVMDQNHPTMSRVGFSSVGKRFVSLVSEISTHSNLLKLNPTFSLLLGEPKDKGDPLVWPRLTLRGNVRFIERSNNDFNMLSQAYLSKHPKSALYIGFADFCFIEFEIIDAFLNGGFGKAFDLSYDDLMVD